MFIIAVGLENKRVQPVDIKRNRLTKLVASQQKVYQTRFTVSADSLITHRSVNKFTVQRSPTQHSLKDTSSSIDTTFTERHF